MAFFGIKHFNDFFLLLPFNGKTSAIFYDSVDIFVSKSRIQKQTHLKMELILLIYSDSCNFRVESVQAIPSQTQAFYQHYSI